MLLGYARVCTVDQTLTPQHDALTTTGGQRTCTDTAAGSGTDRPRLTEALDVVRPGHTLGI